MARTALMRWLQGAAKAAYAELHEPADAHRRDLGLAHQEARRAFIRSGLVLGAATALPVWARVAAVPPRVFVVGAGLAGLAAARELAKAGVDATIVEGSPRVGGRCWTERRAFDDGQIAERGGELVDTSHDTIIDLALELGLVLDDLQAAEIPGAQSRFVIGGGAYLQADVVADFRRLWPRLAADASVVGDGLSYRKFTPAQQRLDRMSATQWIDARVAGGMASRFGQLLANAYIEELGGHPDEINAVTVVDLLGGSPRDRWSPYEESDQRYHVRGGNDQLVARMAEPLTARISTGTKLTALARTDGGRYRLTLQRDQATSDEIADRVVLAIPFTMLRDVDLTRAGFGARKLQAIRELGMGRNTKLQLQFSDRAWVKLGANGETRIDGSYQVSWEVSRAQPGAAGILNFFSGGATAVRAGNGTPEERAQDALRDLTRAYPGVAGLWNGRVIRNAWDRNPWSRGSYALLLPGQYTAFHGVEDSIEGGVHFAGEQSSMDASGYMDGAVESGQRAAREVLAATGVARPRRAA